MKWFRKDFEPVTTERYVLVENERGETGRVTIAWKNGHPTYAGVVYKMKQSYNPDGSVSEEEKIVLDADPSFVD